ncbi:LysE family transporter [Sungkyunkwania multivorans]|uniref:LysE family transporter n=1 Tax=Sungkyunkwania multivorans TaxID=1173618 RepID=A0ABW3D304_9FLAO
MSLIGYFFIGIVATFFGAIPLGTVNLSVISTTLKQDVRSAMKIALAAGFAEIILSFFALHCSLGFTNFIETHQWIQVSIVLLLLAIGLLLFFKKQKTANDTIQKRFSSKYGIGFFLGLLNPPVVVYWILAISYIDMKAVPLSVHTPIIILIIFFLGVYIGKVLTLFLYSKISAAIKNKLHTVAQRMNKVMGALLVLISIIQSVKLFIP